MSALLAPLAETVWMFDRLQLHCPPALNSVRWVRGHLLLDVYVGKGHSPLLCWLVVLEDRLPKEMWGVQHRILPMLESGPGQWYLEPGSLSSNQINEIGVGVKEENLCPFPTWLLWCGQEPGRLERGYCDTLTSEIWKIGTGQLRLPQRKTISLSFKIPWSASYPHSQFSEIHCLFFLFKSDNSWHFICI
jgi:hypothetical protein